MVRGCVTYVATQSVPHMQTGEHVREWTLVRSWFTLVRKARLLAVEAMRRQWKLMVEVTVVSESEDGYRRARTHYTFIARYWSYTRAHLAMAAHQRYATLHGSMVHSAPEIHQRYYIIKDTKREDERYA